MTSDDDPFLSCIDHSATIPFSDFPQQILEVFAMPLLSEVDPKVSELIRLEQQRQESTLELIASENHVSRISRIKLAAAFRAAVSGQLS